MMVLPDAIDIDGIVIDGMFIGSIFIDGIIIYGWYILIDIDDMFIDVVVIDRSSS